MALKTYFTFFLLLSGVTCKDFDEDWSSSSGAFDCLSILCQNKKTASHGQANGINSETFDHEITHLDMHFHKLKSIPTGRLAKSSFSLQILDFSNNEIKKIAVGDFPWLPYVHTLLLDYNKIETIEPRALDNLTSLHTLSLVENKLERLPTFIHETHVVKLDASFNQIRHVLPFDVSIHKSLEELYLQKNQVSLLTKEVFKKNQYLVMLDLSNNPLRQLEPGFLKGPRKIYKLNLRNTELNEFPVTDVAGIRHLDIRDIPALWSIPDSSLFKNLEKIEVTYSVHCCAFRSVSRESFPLPRAVLGCNDHPRKDKVSPTAKTPLSTRNTDTTLSATTSPRGISLNSQTPHVTQSGEPTEDTAASFWDLERFFNTKNGGGKSLTPKPTLSAKSKVSSGLGGMLDHFQSLIDSFRSNSTSPPLCSSKSNVTFVFQPHVGRHVRCSPTPDPFNPCDDVMGSMFLRIFCWFVAFLALIGNVCQVIVIYTNNTEMTVYKLLMYHLAIANFIMGLYLLILCCLDVHTFGRYHNFVQGWQYSGGCKVAGFLAIFSAELSISILLIVTIERYLLIVHALRAHWQMRLIHAKIALLLAWAYAFSIAALPLTDNISSYNKVAICLPFEVGTHRSKAYVLWLLSFNAATFMYIAVAYCRMYLSVNEREPCQGVNTDLQVAKRMSLIMFSNLGSWIPISIAGYLTLFSDISMNIEISKFLLVFGFPLNAWTNPFLYAFFTRIFQEDVIHILNKFNICTGKDINRQRQKLPYTRNRFGSRASDTTNASTLLGQTSLQRMESSFQYQVNLKPDQSPLQRFLGRSGDQGNCLVEKRNSKIPHEFDGDRSYLNISADAKVSESKNHLIAGISTSSLDPELIFRRSFEKYGRARSISEALNPADDDDYEATLQVVGLNLDDLSPVTGITSI